MKTVTICFSRLEGFTPFSHLRRFGLDGYLFHLFLQSEKLCLDVLSKKKAVLVVVDV